MAHIFTMVSPKGGAGKTTIALLLACELIKNGRTVTMIDADPNQPLHHWQNLGNSPEGIKIMIDNDPNGETIFDTMDAAAEQSDFVIVDTEGTSNNRVSQAVSQSHLAIIPFTDSTLDLREAGKAIRLIKNMERMSKSKIPFCMIKTRVNPAIRSRESKATDANVKSQGLPVLDQYLFQRDAYLSITRYGSSLHDLTDKEAPGLPKARENADLLMRAVMKFYAEHKAEG